MCTQVEPDRRWQSRIKIRIRGSQFGGASIGNKGDQRASAKEAKRNPVSQQEQARPLNSYGLQTEQVPSSWQSHHSTQGIQDAEGVLDKTTSQLRLTQKEDDVVQAGSQGVKTSLTDQLKPDSTEQSQAANPESNVATGSTAAAHLPVRGSAPSLVGLPQTERSPPAESPQPEVEAAVQGAISVVGSWNAALGQGTAVPLLTAISEEPTPAMLQYAAAPAQLPPSGMTCEAWLGQADQRRYLKALPALLQQLSSPLDWCCTACRSCKAWLSGMTLCVVIQNLGILFGSSFRWQQKRVAAKHLDLQFISV